MRLSSGTVIILSLYNHITDGRGFPVTKQSNWTRPPTMPSVGGEHLTMFPGTGVCVCVWGGRGGEGRGGGGGGSAER